MVESAVLDAGRRDGQARPAWREVYVLGGLRGLSFAGDVMAETAILLFLVKHGAAAYAVMALLLAAAVPPALLAPVAGAVADRLDSRLVITVVAALQALCCFAMVLWPSPVTLIALSVLLSAGLAFTHPVLAGLPRSMVGAENVPRASSISQTCAMAGMIAAPALAGVLTSRFGIRIPLVIDGASFALVVAGGFVIKTRLHGSGQGRAAEHSAAEDAEKRQESTGEAETSAQESGPVYRVRSDRFLRSVLTMAGTVIACVSMANVFLVFYVTRTFGASGTTFGIIVSCEMVGLIIGGIAVGRIKRIRHEDILIGSLLCLAVGVLGTGLSPGVWWIVPFYLIGGIGNGAMATELHIVLNLRVPDSHRGRGFAALGAISNTAPAVGYLIAVLLLVALAPRYAFICAGVAALLCVVAFSRPLLRRGEQAEAATEQAPTTDAA